MAVGSNDPFALPEWVVIYIFFVLSAPTVLPIVAGVVCGFCMDWVSMFYGFLVGLGVAVMGFIALIVFLLVLPAISADESGAGPFLAWTSLTVTLAIQLSFVVGNCCLANRRRSGSWDVFR